MSATCHRCGRTCVRPHLWGHAAIAGLVVGHLCPSCQTPQDELEVDLANSRPDAVARALRDLTLAYPTPDIMRNKANQLAAARRDRFALLVVSVMRSLADEMATAVR